jgi:Domain of unknown function (DUF4265)
MYFSTPMDDEGYPPTEVESIWVKRLSDTEFVIDNIPFFASEIALNDRVRGQITQEGQLWFDSLIEPRGHSTIRVIVIDQALFETVVKEVKGLVESCEIYRDICLIAVDVPTSTDISPLLIYLQKKLSDGIIDFEEGAMRHNHP